jgi:chaperonin cofactor prefoldin
MRTARLVPALAAGAILVAATAPAMAQDAPAVEGVGTTTGALTLLGLDAGELLSLDLLTDAGVANIDEAAGARSAAAQISALALDTAVTGPVSVPLFAVESTGEPKEAAQDVPIPANPVVSGAALPLSLSAVVGDDGARSALGAALADLNVLGGILGLQGADLDLGSTALRSGSAATRGVSVQDLEVLDLEALLAGLGISLTDLPLDTLLGLLDGLGLLDQLPVDLGDVTVDGVLDVVDGLLDQATPLVAQVDSLTGQIDQLETAVDELGTAGGQTCTTVLTPIGGLLGGTTVTQLCTDVTSAVTTITNQVTTLEGTLTTVRATLQPILDQLRSLLSGPDGVLGLLDSTSLLNVDGLDVNVVTQATDDVATSVADVTATLGSVQVGALPSLGAIDLGAGVAQVDAVLGQVESAIGGVLGQIAPSLSDLVSVSTLQEDTSVVEEAGQVVARAGFTGLVVEVQPVLAEIEALLAGLGDAGSLGAVLDGLGLPVPTSGATEVLALNEALASVTEGLPLLGGLAALDEVLSLRVASMSQQSAFAAVPTTPVAPAAPGAPAQTPDSSLPRTGSSDTAVLLLAVGAAVVALGGRQLLRRSAG